MSKKTSVRETLYQDELGGIFKLQYFLEQEHSTIEGEEARIAYGIRVVKLDADGAFQEERRILDITSRESVIDHLLLLMCRNQVTPVTAMDVVEDFVTYSL